MHATHASNPSVSASSTSSNGGTNGTSKKQRQTSRGNSISSSVVTVKRPASVSSSGTAVRTGTAPMRAQSPAGETSLVALRVGREQEHKRRKSSLEPAERGNVEGLDNLNRWSQSTNSSAASKRNRSSSGAALNFSQAFSPTRRNRATIDHSPRASPNRQSHISRPGLRRQVTGEESPARDRRKASKNDIASPINALPPLSSLPGLTDPNDTESPLTIQTIATPSTLPTNGQDYFGGGEDGVSPRSNPKIKKPAMIRNHTAPMSAFGSSKLQVAEGAQDTSKRHKSVDSRETMIKAIQVDQPGESSKREGRRSSRSKGKDKGEKDKKGMLSKALQKANTAVLLDNAQNFEGALDAYEDACRLLQQVMDRSSAEDDQRKLAAIKVTYTNRIEELRQLEADRPSTSDEKSLPVRPMSDDSYTSPDATVSPIERTLRDSAMLDAAASGSANDVPKLSFPGNRDRDSFFSRTIAAVEGSAQAGADRRTTFLSTPSLGDERGPASQHARQRSEARLQPSPLEDAEPRKLEPSHSRAPSLQTRNVHLPAHDHGLIPTPLSPRRPSRSPSRALGLDETLKPAISQAQQEQPTEAQLDRAETTESTSWLNTIDESGSDTSSVHSVGSQRGLRRKRLRRATSDSTNPDFDAAFDAAVEAAYDQGLEPDMEGRRRLRDSIYKAHAARESVMLPNSAIKEILSPTNAFHPHKTLSVENEEDEEEERFLDDMTQDYANTFNFDLTGKSALPRQSDSSGYSRDTWQSSQVSDRTTAGTSLSTVAEDTLPARFQQQAATTTPSSSLNSVLAENLPPSAPPPKGALPAPPSLREKRLSGVRDRRLSGQNAKQLKIETTTQPEVRKRASTYHQSASPFTEEEPQLPALETTDSELQHDHMLKSPPSLDMLSTVSDNTRPTTATTAAVPRISEDNEEVGELRSYRPPVLRKNKSSASLRGHEILSPTDEYGPGTSTTPMSSTFSMMPSRRYDSSNPLTSQRANFPPLGGTATEQTGGHHLFDTTLTSVPSNTLPSSPLRSPTSTALPTALEPCPESHLLRPFWLMRSIASTLTQPKGGFLTTRLFVSREVWATRGVKLKGVEDKIANCDLLTAALGRLAGVDTLDAEAVAEELQGFEEVMERVQIALAKKLGSEVGGRDLGFMFKDAPAGSSAQTEAAAAAPQEKTKSKEGKSYLSSLRKLRSKSSGTPLGNSGGNGNSGSHAAAAAAAHFHAEKEVPTMASVPMTSFVPVERRGRGVKDMRVEAFEGPWREYMASLARLFEGVRVLDLIARQVEDPGLKGSSPAHVGLELSVRHAAEFFAFYVCRFVLGDLGTLVDKYVKRGTEWVVG